MSEQTVKTQQKQMDRAQQAANEAESKVINAAGMFGDGGFQAMEHGLRRAQEMQWETIRCGGDIVLMNMTMMNRLTECRKPEDALNVGQETMKAIQDRVNEYMDRARDLTSRQMTSVTDYISGHPSA